MWTTGWLWLLSSVLAPNGLQWRRHAAAKPMTCHLLTIPVIWRHIAAAVTGSQRNMRRAPLRTPLILTITPVTTRKRQLSPVWCLFTYACLSALARSLSVETITVLQLFLERQPLLMRNTFIIRKKILTYTCSWVFLVNKPHKKRRLIKNFEKNAGNMYIQLQVSYYHRLVLLYYYYSIFRLSDSFYFFSFADKPDGHVVTLVLS